MLRRALKETIKKHDPGWTPGEMLCVDCLDLVREEYVEDALREEVGELTQLDQEVIRSMREQETLTENINVAFEKNITFGQHLADHVASFGGSWIFLHFVEFDSLLFGGDPSADHHDEPKSHRNPRPLALGE
jgi:hypothetical protein